MIFYTCTLLHQKDLLFHFCHLQTCMLIKMIRSNQYYSPEVTRCVLQYDCWPTVLGASPHSAQVTAVTRDRFKSSRGHSSSQRQVAVIYC